MASPEKIKRNEVAALRTRLHKEQGRKCALCNQRLKLADAVLDHDHSSGHCRAVIHADCNVLLGKVENYASRHGKRLTTEGRIQFALKYMFAYMTNDWKHMPLHWMHKTDHDKEVLRIKRLIRRSKKPETKAKWRKKLKEIQQ